MDSAVTHNNNMVGTAKVVREIHFLLFIIILVLMLTKLEVLAYAEMSRLESRQGHSFPCCISESQCELNSCEE